jgi:hypothetical protein
MPSPQLANIYEKHEVAASDFAKKAEITPFKEKDSESDSEDIFLPASGDIAMAAGLAVFNLGQTPDHAESGKPDRGRDDQSVEQAVLTESVGDIFNVAPEISCAEFALSQDACTPTDAPQQFVLTLPGTWWPAAEVMLERIGGEWLMSIRSRSTEIEQTLRSKAGVLIDRFAASGFGKLAMGAATSAWRKHGDDAP